MEIYEASFSEIYLFYSNIFKKSGLCKRNCKKKEVRMIWINSGILFLFRKRNRTH